MNSLRDLVHLVYKLNGNERTLLAAFANLSAAQDFAYSSEERFWTEGQPDVQCIVVSPTDGKETV